MCKVNLTIIIIKTVGSITKKFVVVDPDIVCALHRDGVIANHFINDKVANNHVRLPDDLETSAVNDTRSSNSNNRRIVSCRLVA